VSRRGAVLEGFQAPRPLEFEYLQRNAEMLQSEKMQNRQLEHRRAADDANAREAAKKETLEKIKNLDHIGNSTVDIATDNAIASVQSNAERMLGSGASVNEVKAYIQREVPAITNGHTIAKNYSDQMRKGAIEMAKIYGGDPEKLYQMSMQKAVPEWFDADENGTLKYKPMIDPNKNYLAEMEKMENLPNWVPESNDLIEHVSKLPKDELTSNVVVRDKGFAHIDKQTEEVNALYKPIYDKKGQLVGKEVVVDASGAMPEAQFDIFLQNPKAKAQFAREYLPIRRAENEEMKRLGLGELSPEADKLLQRQVAAKLAQSGISGLKSKSEVQDITPKPTNVSVRNYGSGGASGVDIREMYGSIHRRLFNPGEDEMMIRVNEKSIGVPMNELESDQKDAILDAVNKGRTEGTAYNIENIFIAKDGNDIVVVDKSKYVPTESGEINKDAKITTLSKTGTDIKAQTGVKPKQAVVERDKGAKPAAPAKASGTIRFRGPDGKMYEGTQETIDKMNKAKVKYTIIN
jgi:hypothetical protein